MHIVRTLGMYNEEMLNRDLQMSSSNKLEAVMDVSFVPGCTIF